MVITSSAIKANVRCLQEYLSHSRILLQLPEHIWTPVNRGSGLKGWRGTGLDAREMLGVQGSRPSHLIPRSFLLRYGRCDAAAQLPDRQRAALLNYRPLITPERVWRQVHRQPPLFSLSRVISSQLPCNLFTGWLVTPADLFHFQHGSVPINTCSNSHTVQLEDQITFFTSRVSLHVAKLKF